MEEYSVKWHQTDSQQGGTANKGCYAPNRGVALFKHTFHGSAPIHEPMRLLARHVNETRSSATCLFQEVWFCTFSGLSALFNGNGAAKAEADPLHSDLCSSFWRRTRSCWPFKNIGWWVETVDSMIFLSSSAWTRAPLSFQRTVNSLVCHWLWGRPWCLCAFFKSSFMVKTQKLDR